MTKPLLYLVPLLLVPVLGACHSKAPDQSPPTVMATDPNAVATDWTVENPTEPAVPVELPTTR